MNLTRPLLNVVLTAGLLTAGPLGASAQAAAPAASAVSATSAAATSTTSAAAGLTAQQAERAERLQGTLRCPICKGESINESPNDISREMRAEVQRLVAMGQSDREIYDHFAARYGQFVLLDPPKQGVNLLLWAGPVLALLAGGWWLLSAFRARPSAPGAEGMTRGTAPVAVEETGPLDPELLPYLEQVQREARVRTTVRSAQDAGERT